MRQSTAIMYHSVGLEALPWCFSHISLPIHVFAECMAALRRKGYGSAFFKDHLPGERHSRREVVLTFDDGYLDNWVHVLSILQANGLRGTVFLNPDFADPRDVMRPQADPSAVFGDGEHKPERCCAGFLSWPEMRRMEASGCMDVQSHALTHTWYEKGPRIVDFWRPGSATDPAGHIWMLWNRFPEFKPFYLTQASAWEKRIPYGTPIYEHGKALETRRFFPPDKLDHILPAFVEEQGGERFFERPDWRERLFRQADQHGGSRSVADQGRLETETEYLTRVRYELSASKRILEEKLDKRINSICWPGGGLTEQVVQMARELGYERFTLPSAWARSRAQGQFADMCPRVGGGMRIPVGPGAFAKLTPTEFLWRVEARAGSMPHRVAGKLAIMARRTWYRMGGAGLSGAVSPGMLIWN